MIDFSIGTYIYMYIAWDDMYYIHTLHKDILKNLRINPYSGLILNSHTKITGFQILILITRLILIAHDPYSGNLLYLN